MRCFLSDRYRCLSSMLRRHRQLAVLAFLPAVFLAWSSAAAGDAPTVAVEEDWELQLVDPHAGNAAPQITCCLSPSANIDSVHALFLLNHRTLPDFARGGMDVQLWNGSRPVASRTHPTDAVLATPGEVVRWTVRMNVEDGQLHFRVVQGTSTTWGSFGNQGYLQVSADTSLFNLNGYDPQVSVSNSGPSYGGNRVRKLVLKESRWYTSNGLVRTSAAPLTVVEHTE